MRNKIIAHYDGLGYLGLFFIALSLVLNRLFGASNLSSFFQGFFVSLGIVCMVIGLFRTRKEKE